MCVDQEKGLYGLPALSHIRLCRTFGPVVHQEEGCEQYELFQSLDDPDKLVILERWASQELLDKHGERERTRYAPLIKPLLALWAPGATPSVERFETG